MADADDEREVCPEQGGEAVIYTSLVFISMLLLDYSSRFPPYMYLISLSK